MAGEFSTFALVGGTTTASGTSGIFTVTGALTGHRAWTLIPNGTKTIYSRTDASGAFEEATCTVGVSGGVATVTRIAVRHSSNSNVAVNWAPGGTQNVVCGPSASEVALRSNNLADLADTAAALAILGGIPGVGTAMSGGSAGQIVCRNGAGAVTAVKNTDAMASLFPLWFRASDGIHGSGQEMTGSWTAGSDYWLSGTAGVLTATKPTMSSSVALVYLGYALSSSRLLFSTLPPVRSA
jgi:hypothetical protein